VGTTWGLVERRAAETPDLLALADERNRRCTWADLRDHADRAAAGLAGMGVAPGDVVSWQLPTRIDTIVLSHMTECPIVACGSPTDTDEQLANSEGAPVDGIEVLVADGELQPVAVDVDGDVLVRGPMIAQGYVQEEATTAAFLPGGWFFTGDRGHLRLDGHLTITGRSKDLIIRKGENISPREIEDVLMSHPSVGAVAVIGLPDPERGERVCAVVEPPVSGARLTFDEMVAHCRSARLMTQKIPEQLELVDALPRNPTMKVLKRALVEQLTAARAPRGD
jgi:cyclohexanecarboxylate-CoA ligase